MKSRILKPIVPTLLLAISTAMLGMSVHAGILTNLDVRPAHCLPATEGAPLEGIRVASFTDPGESIISPSIDGSFTNVVTNYTATIDWGDQTTPSLGTVVAGLGQFDVLGTHTYAEHGLYQIVINVSDVDGSTGSTNGNITVRDAALSADGVGTITAKESVELNSVLATFTDANPFGTLADFTATVTWGDGVVEPATVLTNDSGGYQVTGSHTYMVQGSYAMHVDITDTGGQVASAGSTVNVSDAPLQVAGVGTFNTIEGSSYTGLVGTFAFGNTNTPSGEFTNIIDWGDGSAPEPGIVDQTGPGTFELVGTHIYMNEGSFAVSIYVQSSGGSEGSAASTALVGDAQIQAAGTTITSVEGTSTPDLILATFTDGNTNTGAKDYSAIIYWGDGDSSIGDISQVGPGQFQVTGHHTYIEEGSYAIQVDIGDIGGAGASAGSTANVTDAPLSASGTDISAVEGAPFSGPVATFTDANPFAGIEDFTAMVDWGDGVSSTGTVVALPLGGFNVVASHTYAHYNTYAITTQIKDIGTSAASAASTATITDAALTSIGRMITPVEQNSFVAVVASVDDANPYGTADDLTAIVNWGDGSPNSSADVVPNPGAITDGAGFLLMGSHTYAVQGLYPITVTVQSSGGSSTAAASEANTADMPLVGVGTTIQAIKGVAFSNIVATCTDTDSSPEPEPPYTCLINWGDGSTSMGTISEQGDDGASVPYLISGSHTYAQSGSYQVMVTIDNPQTQVSTTARSTVNVAEVPASDVTSQFVIKASKARLDKRTGLVKQVVTIKNVGRTPVSGPVSIVLDNLSSSGGSVELANRDGQILNIGAAPLGSPYKNVNLPKGNMFKGRTARSVTLYFDSPSATINYNARVLSGPGAR